MSYVVSTLVILFFSQHARSTPVADRFMWQHAYRTIFITYLLLPLSLSLSLSREHVVASIFAHDAVRRNSTITEKRANGSAW